MLGEAPDSSLPLNSGRHDMTSDNYKANIHRLVRLPVTSLYRTFIPTVTV